MTPNTSPAQVGRPALYRSPTAVLAVVLLILGAAALVVKLWRLVGDPGPQGAIDIKILYRFTQGWFNGVPIYEARRSGVTYPPATWLILWPAYGWVSLAVARVMWAVIDVVALVVLGRLFSRAVAEGSRSARLCAFLAPFSMPALADALGIGQLALPVLPVAVGAVLLAVRHRPTWPRDLLAAGLFAVALAKPSLTAPLFVPLLIAPRRIRPAVLTVVVYAVLTVVSSQFQAGTVITQLREWQDQVHGNSGMGYGNVQDWLFALGWEGAFAPVSLLLVAALCAFTWYYRRVDIWLLLGVAAIVARLWTYHRVYDDAIVIFAMMATARVALMRPRETAEVPFARATLVLLAIVLWIPLQFHYVGSTVGPVAVGPGLARLYNGTHVVAFVVTLALLTTCACLESKRQLAVARQ